MIKFDEKGLHFDVDLTEEDFKALGDYVDAVRVDERIRLIRFIESTLPKATPEEAAQDAAEEVVEEAPAE